MGVKGKLVLETEIKCSAHKYYQLFKKQAEDFPEILPGKVNAVEVHEGDWHAPGSVMCWTYTLDGKAEIFKERVEHNDSELSVTMVGLEGSDVLEHYKSYVVTFQAIPNPSGGDGGVARLALTYEKHNETIPAPLTYFDFMVTHLIEDFDAHLSQLQ